MAPICDDSESPLYQITQSCLTSATSFKFLQCRQRSRQMWFQDHLTWRQPIDQHTQSRGERIHPIYNREWCWPRWYLLPLRLWRPDVEYYRKVLLRFTDSVDIHADGFPGEVCCRRRLTNTPIRIWFRYCFLQEWGKTNRQENFRSTGVILAFFWDEGNFRPSPNFGDKVYSYISAE